MLRNFTSPVHQTAQKLLCTFVNLPFHTHNPLSPAPFPMSSASAASIAVRRHRLIVIDDAGKLQLHEEGVKALRALPPARVAVLGIVGEARCGKSFLCNQFVAQAAAGVSQMTCEPGSFRRLHRLTSKTRQSRSPVFPYMHHDSQLSL